MATIKRFEKLDRRDWEKFRSGLSQKVSKEEVQLISELHAKYFNHKFKVPCSCSPRIIQGWITELNSIYDEE